MSFRKTGTAEQQVQVEREGLAKTATDQTWTSEDSAELAAENHQDDEEA